MIDRYLIRYFLAVVEQGNFSRAAAHCNVSQPTLSVGIAKLEKNAGLQLFIRTNQRVELTEAGTRFLYHAKRIEKEFNSAFGTLATLSKARHERSLRLGILLSVPGYLVAEAGRACPAASRGSVEISFANERELLGHLARGRLDAILTVLRPTIESFVELPVLEEGYTMVFPANHPMAGRSQVRAEELGSEPMIVRRHCEILSQTSRHFLDRGVRPHFSLRTINDERALEMVRAGMGITIMPESYRASGISQVPLSEFVHRRQLGYYLSDNRYQDQPLLVTLAAALAGTRAT
ncbi:MAG: LysR family transcriptional regulator [Sphingobium sp.]